MPLNETAIFVIDMPVEVVVEARKTFEGGPSASENEDAIEPFEMVAEASMREAMLLRSCEITVTHEFLFVRTIDANVRESFMQKESLLGDRCGLQQGMAEVSETGGYGTMFGVESGIIEVGEKRARR